VLLIATAIALPLVSYRLLSKGEKDGGIGMEVPPPAGGPQGG